MSESHPPQPNPVANPAEAGAAPTPDYEKVAFDAAAAADAAHAEREEAQGSATRAYTERTEASLEEKREEREGKIFADAYAASIQGIGGSEQDMRDRLEQATEDARNAVEADRLWQRTYADKLQEMGATHVADPTDTEDMFNNAARDAADEAVASFNFQNRPRADKMIPNLHQFGQGAAQGREEAERARANGGDGENGGDTREPAPAEGGQTPPPTPPENGEGAGETPPPADGDTAQLPAVVEEEGRPDQANQLELPNNPEFQAALDKWAEAKKKYEDKVGLLKLLNRKGKQMEELKAAEQEVADIIGGLDLEPGEKIALWGKAIKDVEQRQYEISKEAKWYHNKWAKIGLGIAAGVGTAAAVAGTGGAAAIPVALGLSGAAAGVLSGAITGAAAGAAGGAAGARFGRHMRSTREATQQRTNDQLAGLTLAAGQGENYSAYAARTGEQLRGMSQTHREQNEQLRRRAVGRGAIIGAFGGAVLSGLAGSTVGGEGAPSGSETGGGEPDVSGGGDGAAEISPAEARAAEKDIIGGLLDNDPSQISDLPGFEGNVDVTTAESAAEQYPGNYPWDSLQNGANLTDGQTFNAFTEGWARLHEVPGVQIDTWGDIQFTDGSYQTTGDLWGGSIELSQDLSVVDSSGNVHIFEAGTLDNSQHAELLDLARQDGAQFLDQEQLVDYLAGEVEMTPQAVEGLVNDITNEAASTIESLPELPDNLDAGAAIEAQQQAALENFVDAHAETIAALPEGAQGQLTAQIEQLVQVPPEVIQRMIDEAVQGTAAADLTQSNVALAA